MRPVAGFHLVTREDDEGNLECSASFDSSHWGLRIGSIFIILATSVIATILPIALRQSNVVPRPVYE